MQRQQDQQQTEVEEPPVTDSTSVTHHIVTVQAEVHAELGPDAHPPTPSECPQDPVTNSVNSPNSPAEELGSVIDAVANGNTAGQLASSPEEDLVNMVVDAAANLTPSQSSTTSTDGATNGGLSHSNKR